MWVLISYPSELSYCPKIDHKLARPRQSKFSDVLVHIKRQTLKTSKGLDNNLSRVGGERENPETSSCQAFLFTAALTQQLSVQLDSTEAPQSVFIRVIHRQVVQATYNL